MQPNSGLEALTLPLSREEILRLFEALNAELRRVKTRGDLYLAGGAVMCLAFRARESTRDVDAKFEPTAAVREAALRVAEREGISDHWLNDAVRSYLSDRETWSPFLELSHLRVFCADARYMLAMKCQAMRLGEGYHDEEDVRYLLRHLGLTAYADAERILADYYELESYPPKALAAVQELLAARS